MKKINYFFAGFLSLILVTSSCSDDNDVTPSPNVSNEMVIVDTAYSASSSTFESLSGKIGVDKYLFKINDTTIVVKTYFEKTNQSISRNDCAYSAGYVEKYGFHDDLVYATMNAKKIIVHYDVYYKSGIVLNDTIIESVSLLNNKIKNYEI